MKFTERCASGEFRNRPTWTQQERFEYLASRGSDPIFGTVTFEVSEEELKEREELIKAGKLPF